MIKADIKVVNLIHKITQFIEDGKITADNFPMESVCEVIENTLGMTFWECVGEFANKKYRDTAGLYKECLIDAVSRGDIMGCKRILELYVRNYQTLYAVMSEDESTFRKRPYLKMILDLGNAYAQIQHRLHQARQNELTEKENWLLAQGRGVVYTFLTEGDTLYQPEDIKTQADYICFTQQKEKEGIREGVWEYRVIENEQGLEEGLLKSYYRIFAHKVLPEYDYSIWVDPEMGIVGDIVNFCRIFGEGNSFLGFSRSGEDCIYEDISCTQMGMDDMNIYIRKKILRYQKEGYPEHNGLIDYRVMARNHRDFRLHKVMELWWEETQENIGLEENLFNYVAWKSDFPFSVCGLYIYDNPYFVNRKIDLDMKEEF